MSNHKTIENVEYGYKLIERIKIVIILTLLRCKSSVVALKPFITPTFDMSSKVKRMGTHLTR